MQEQDGEMWVRSSLTSLASFSLLTPRAESHNWDKGGHRVEWDQESLKLRLQVTTQFSTIHNNWGMSMYSCALFMYFSNSLRPSIYLKSFLGRVVPIMSSQKAFAHLEPWLISNILPTKQDSLAITTFKDAQWQQWICCVDAVHACRLRARTRRLDPYDIGRRR